MDIGSTWFFFHILKRPLYEEANPIMRYLLINGVPYTLILAINLFAFLLIWLAMKSTDTHTLMKSSALAIIMIGNVFVVLGNMVAIGRVIWMTFEEDIRFLENSIYLSKSLTETILKIKNIHCIDKQKVKDAIIKILKTKKVWNIDTLDFIQKFNKELGLEWHLKIKKLKFNVWGWD